MGNFKGNEMNEMTVVAEQRALTAGEIRAHVNRVQEVMKAVMQRETHYGVIPGSKKPSLYKPGAEVLCVTFRVAQSYKVEDLSTADSVRYRIACIGTHQTTGVVLGEGIGECSSNEEKYKWRRAICKEEFDGTPADRKRVKFSKYRDNIEKTEQIRTEPADIANTVLKMAAKRAQVAMTLNVTAASDCFTQDIEDLPEELQELERSREQATAKQDLPPYPAAEFAKSLTAWRKAIGEGKANADQLIARSSTKYTLSEEQKAAIRAPFDQPKTKENPPIDGGFVKSYEEAAQ
jgi:hypothetical protein